jgi:hypothetical protein
MEKECKEIVELLVDYADSELSEDQKSMVSQHLAQCRNCSELLEGLRKSLVIAGDIWNDNLNRPEAVSKKATSKRKTWARYGLIAASIAVTSITLVCWQTVHRIYSNSKTNTDISMSKITQQIEEAGRAAKLLAAADLLRTSPTAHKIAENQYRYIVEQYPKTKAATQAKTYLAQIKKGDT